MFRNPMVITIGARDQEWRKKRLGVRIGESSRMDSVLDKEQRLSEGHSEAEDWKMDFNGWRWGGVESTSEGCRGAGPTGGGDPKLAGGHRFGGTGDSAGRMVSDGTSFHHIPPLFSTFPHFPHFPPLSNFLSLFANFRHFSSLFPTISHFSPLFLTFPTFRHFSPLLTTFSHISPLFPTFPNFSQLFPTFPNFFPTFPHF